MNLTIRSSMHPVLKSAVFLFAFFSMSLLLEPFCHGAPQANQLYGTLVTRAREISSNSISVVPSLETWQQELPAKRKQWLMMLGLDPLPERTNIKMTITGTLDCGSYVIDKMHFQPLPDCRIAANLYRPKNISGRAPAVIYVCGHSKRGKFNYQLHPRWFAQHGYVAMILDPIQAGENDSVHHGTYTHGWWHWISQGYTPAGVEVWAAMRAADYLQSRKDVDPARLGITGNSGGGTISWFTGAADPRFKVVAPSCQTGTIYQHVRDRTVDGHCDCSFWINTFAWDFTDIAALIAPRPLLVSAATEDTLFRPYAWRDLTHRVRLLYRLYGEEEKIELTEAVTKHGYSPKTRLAIFSWFDRHLKDSDVPVVEDITENPHDDAELAVYRTRNPPADDRMKKVDQFFLTMPKPPEFSERDNWLKHQSAALQQLREMTFRQIPETIKIENYTCRKQGQNDYHQFRTFEFDSEPGITIRAHLAAPINCTKPYPLIVGAVQPDARTTYCARGAGNTGFSTNVAGYACVEVRGTGNGSIGPGLEWSVRRSYPLVGQSYYERKTLDLLAAISVLRQQPDVGKIIVYGEGAEAAVAVYAALLDSSIAEIILQNPVTTHWQGGPEFLNVLKTGDLPHNLALAFPRPITFIGEMPTEYQWTQRCYESCGEGSQITVDTKKVNTD